MSILKYAKWRRNGDPSPDALNRSFAAPVARSGVSSTAPATRDNRSSAAPVARSGVSSTAPGSRDNRSSDAPRGRNGR